MELRVFWTDTALNQLKDIFYYYKVKANQKVAKEIVSKLVNRTIQLEKNPRSGQKEPLLPTESLNIDTLLKEITK